MLHKKISRVIKYEHKKDVRHFHWHFVYRRRHQRNGVSTGEIIVGQVLAMVGSLAAGFLLDVEKHNIILFAGALLLLPGTIDLSASITGVVVTKINHRLESGQTKTKALLSSNGFGLVSTVVSGLIVGVTGGLVGSVFFEADFFKIVQLTMLTMLSVCLIAFPVSSYFTLAARYARVNPDNVVGPIETGLTDFLTVLMVAVWVRVLF